MLLSLILGEINWSNITGNWIEFATSGYTYVFQNFFWPIVFFGITGYVYAVNRSATAAAALICILFTVFGFTNVFAAPELGIYSQLNWVVVVVSLSGLFVAVFTKKYR